MGQVKEVVVVVKDDFKIWRILSKIYVFLTKKMLIFEFKFFLKFEASIKDWITKYQKHTLINPSISLNSLKIIPKKS